jgi:hypothetical protein
MAHTSSSFSARVELCKLSGRLSSLAWYSSWSARRISTASRQRSGLAGDPLDGGSDMVAAQGEVYVQFWLRVGEAPVEMSLDEKGQEEIIPAVLKRKLRIQSRG